MSKLPYTAVERFAISSAGNLADVRQTVTAGLAAVGDGTVERADALHRAVELEHDNFPCDLDYEPVQDVVRHDKVPELQRVALAGIRTGTPNAVHNLDSGEARLHEDGKVAVAVRGSLGEQRA